MPLQIMYYTTFYQGGALVYLGSTLHVKNSSLVVFILKSSFNLKALIFHLKTDSNNKKTKQISLAQMLFLTNIQKSNLLEWWVTNSVVRKKQTTYETNQNAVVVF